MIERQFVKENLRLFKIQEYLDQNLRGVGLSHIKLQRTPLGDQIVVFASRPGLIVGRKGANIKALTAGLKKRFDLNNPQIEISEITNLYSNARIVAEKITLSLENFGSKRFKGIMHRSLEEVLRAGALGVEIVMSGKLPSSRSRTWRVSAGYLKKCGESVVSQVDTTYSHARLKTGVVGIKVSIIPADVVLPDRVELRTPEEMEIEYARMKAEIVAFEEAMANKGKKKKRAKKKATKKKAAPKAEEAPAAEKKPETPTKEEPKEGDSQ